jgi:hypothetical protein
VQYSAIQCRTVQLQHGGQLGTIQYSILQYITVQYTVVQYTVVQYSALHYTALLHRKAKATALTQ